MDETRREGEQPKTCPGCAVRGCGRTGKVQALSSAPLPGSDLGRCFHLADAGETLPFGAVRVARGAGAGTGGCAKAEPLQGPAVPKAPSSGVPNKPHPLTPVREHPQTPVCCKRGEKCRMEPSLALQQGEGMWELLHSPPAPSSHLQGMEEQQLQPSPSGEQEPGQELLPSGPRAPGFTPCPALPISISRALSQARLPPSPAGVCQDGRKAQPGEVSGALAQALQGREQEKGSLNPNPHSAGFWEGFAVTTGKTHRSGQHPRGHSPAWGLARRAVGGQEGCAEPCGPLHPFCILQAPPGLFPLGQALPTASAAVSQRTRVFGSSAGHISRGAPSSAPECLGWALPEQGADPSPAAAAASPARRESGRGGRAQVPVVK